MFKLLKKGGKSPPGEDGKGHKPALFRSGSKRKHTGFFRTARILTGALLASALITLAVPKASYSQEKDTSRISVSIEDSVLYMKIRDDATGSYETHGVFLSSFANGVRSMDLVKKLPASWEGYGDGCYLIFQNWALGVFPEHVRHGGIFPADSPDGKNFFMSDSSFLQMGGGILLVSPGGISGFANRMPFRINFSETPFKIPELSGPKVEILPAEGSGGNSAEITDPAIRKKGMHLTVNFGKTIDIDWMPF